MSNSDENDDLGLNGVSGSDGFGPFDEDVNPFDNGPGIGPEAEDEGDQAGGDLPLPNANLDEMGSEPPFGQDFMDDPLAVLEYFTRKEIMKVVVDVSTRYYQSVAFKDGKIPSMDEAVELYKKIFNQSAYQVAVCLSDDIMSAMFASVKEKHGHAEDPWILAKDREMARIIAAQAGD